MVLTATLAIAQNNQPATADTTFCGTLVNDEYQVWLDIDFYAKDILVPDQELFGELAGYLGARRDPRKWLITDAEILSPNAAQLEIINDYGSEDLTATLTLLPDGSYQLRQNDGSPIRIVVNRKWLKLPKTLIFKREHKKP